MVYFFRHGKYVKIGHTKYKYHLEHRLSNLQTASPEFCELLGTMPGDRAQEAELHHRFRKLRVRGEWFDLKDELREFIDTYVHAHTVTENKEIKTLIKEYGWPEVSKSIAILRKKYRPNKHY